MLDDDRARAALAILGELAQHTQVLFLSEMMRYMLYESNEQHLAWLFYHHQFYWQSFL